ncbi:phenazine biosynthesis protein [Streptomyces aurantiogriseus]|uniref:Phenazine antibiotic biosynthesis protein n=1 Tax=Streptomyces aurantiogriseus TaxID=66870 RepID=A0A918C1Y0_9ACTN|nr:phenazine biosynthesis protein [Streptomyces aurantiogriseus]GGR02725.1 phenazine antibiotic biosynthesis protein [Streptomyces aurantiogriseus]
MTSDFDSHVRATVAWHFDPDTGSPFWLGKRAALDFDPVREVRTAADLARFPDVSEELRTVPVADLIPRGLRDKPFRVYESGGTTGAPKRIVDAEARGRMLLWARERLTELGVPAAGDWLHLGPSGPHVVGSDVARHAAMGGGLFHTVDFDPRWVKRLVGNGRGDLADEYIGHLLDQAETVLRSQDISVLNTTPPVLEAICARPDLYELVRGQVKAVIWGGMSAGQETVRLLEEEFFPQATVAGVYGNSLMGVAPQRPAHPGDSHRCVFQAHPATTRVQLVDDDGREVAYGERGRVLLHLVTDEMFLPNVLERDTAIRVPPAPGATTDGIADIRTVRSMGQARIVEGVY